MMKPKATLPGIGPTAAGKRATLDRKTIRCFLDHLAATCHVQGSAAAAGASATGLYKRRRSDPAFAAAWRDAVQAGYERLEEALLARALSDVAAYAVDEGAVAVELTDTGGDAGAPRSRAGVAMAAGMSGKVARVDVQLALTLLNRRAAVEARGRERHTRRRPSADEVEKALTAKLDTLSRRLAAPDR